MASHRRPSSTVNPFDSDEDESPPQRSRPASRANSNPFDDDSDTPPPSKPVRTAPRGGRQQESRREPKPSAPSFDARNPFDDDDDSPPAPRVKHATRAGHDQESRRDPKPSAPSFDARNPFDDDSPPAVHVKPGSSHGPPAQRSFFDDDEPELHPDLRNNGHDAKLGTRKSGMSQMKERASASSDAALRKAQRFKDAGANQASKVLEGGFAQAQKLKGSSYNAFKSDERKGELNRGKPRSQSREQLLGAEGEDLFKTRNDNTTRTRYDDNQFQSGDLEYKSMEELEGYALQKSEDTTKSVQNCVKIVEEIKEDATKTLLTLHEQGEQIRRTHDVTLDIDTNLSSGEKLLGNLGGMFSRTWKPKKGRPVTGPAVMRNDSFKRRGHHLEQRVALGLVKGPKSRSSPDADPQYGQQTAQAKLDNERKKQDDGLSDLSYSLEQLKVMSLDMGSEISSQIPELGGLEGDVITLNERVKYANERGRRLLKR